MLLCGKFLFKTRNKRRETRDKILFLRKRILQRTRNYFFMLLCGKNFKTNTSKKFENLQKQLK